MFDACEQTAVAAIGASDEQLASLDAALAMWRTDGIPGLVRGDAAALHVEFRDAGPTLFGFYDDATATVYVSLRLDDHPRAITIAHELGHALGLVHVPAATSLSVMNPGNLDVAPTSADAAALATLWGSCPGP